MKRPGLVVAAAILLCVPMAPSFLSGTLAPAAAMERFLLALSVAWAGAAMVSAVVTRYSNQARRAEIIHQLEEARRAGAPTLPLQPDQVLPPRGNQP